MATVYDIAAPERRKSQLLRLAAELIAIADALDAEPPPAVNGDDDPWTDAKGAAEMLCSTVTTVRCKKDWPFRVKVGRSVRYSIKGINRYKEMRAKR